MYSLMNWLPVNKKQHLFSRLGKGLYQKHVYPEVMGDIVSICVEDHTFAFLNSVWPPALHRKCAARMKM